MLTFQHGPSFDGGSICRSFRMSIDINPEVIYDEINEMPLQLDSCIPMINWIIAFGITRHCIKLSTSQSNISQKLSKSRDTYKALTIGHELKGNDIIKSIYFQFYPFNLRRRVHPNFQDRFPSFVTTFWLRLKRVFPIPNLLKALRDISLIAWPSQVIQYVITHFQSWKKKLMSFVNDLITRRTADVKQQINDPKWIDNCWIHVKKFSLAKFIEFNLTTAATFGIMKRLGEKVSSFYIQLKPIALRIGIIIMIASGNVTRTFIISFVKLFQGCQYTTVTGLKIVEKWMRETFQIFIEKYKTKMPPTTSDPNTSKHAATLVAAA